MWSVLLSLLIGCCLAGAGGGGFLAAITNKPDQYDKVQKNICSNSVSHMQKQYTTNFAYIC